jgi:hypothetical protein
MVIDQLRKTNHVPEGPNLEDVIAPTCQEMFANKESEQFLDCFTSFYNKLW